MQIEILVIIILAIIPILYLISRNYNARKVILVVLGSGGHTAEMLRLLPTISQFLSGYRTLFVIADSDNHSQAALAIFLAANQTFKDSEIQLIPRSRSVGQSLINSIPSIINSVVGALKIVLNSNPVILLCNGPVPQSPN